MFGGRDLHEVELEAHERSAARRKKPLSPTPPGLNKQDNAGHDAAPSPSAEVPSTNGQAINSNSSPESTPLIRTVPFPPGVNGTPRMARPMSLSVSSSTSTPANPIVIPLHPALNEDDGEGQDAEPGKEIPKFRHVPGIGLIPETPVEKQDDEEKKAEGDDGDKEKESESEYASATASPVEPTTALLAPPPVAEKIAQESTPPSTSATTLVEGEFTAIVEVDPTVSAIRSLLTFFVSPSIYITLWLLVAGLIYRSSLKLILILTFQSHVDVHFDSSNPIIAISASQTP